MSADGPRDDVEIRSPSLGIVLVVGAALGLLLLLLSVAGGWVLYERLRPTRAVKARLLPREAWDRIMERAREYERTQARGGGSPSRGGLAPDLTLETIRGERLSLEALRGKRVILDFWATWCKPCVDGIPDLNRLAREWGPDVVVIGITAEDPAHVKAFARKTTMDYHVVAGRGDDSLPSPFREVDAFPTLFFIERDGRIQSRLEGGHHYDCLESRLWMGDAAARWAQGRRQEALDLAARTLEVHIDADTEAGLAEIFGRDPAYVALHDRVKDRTEQLLGLYERKYDRELGRDRASVVWVIWSFGAEHRDKDAAPVLRRYLRESTLEEARWRAADALWQIRDKGAVGDLISGLGDPSLKVQGFSASALGDLGDRRAVDPLLALFANLPDNREETKARIADALGKLGDPRALAPLEASLTEIREARYVYWTAPAVQRLRHAAGTGSDVAMKP